MVTQKTAICLIKSAITGLSEPLPEGGSIQQALDLMGKQAILPMGYMGAVNCGVSVDSEMLQAVADYYCSELIYSERQMDEINRIYQAFEENEIPYMPVKGAIVKHLYPSHELRGMSDADILIHQEEYPKIRQVMLSIGFTEEKESDHEYVWKSPFLQVELHKRLIPSYNRDLYSFFGIGWERAKINSGYRWEMTAEDAFIFDFIHFTKHYRDSDVHCRFIVDLWVRLRHFTNMDMQYIAQQMASMHLDVFYGHILRLIDAWFGDGAWDEHIEYITRTVMNVDKDKKHQSNEIAKKTRAAHNAGSYAQYRWTNFFHRIFPDKQTMNWAYPKWKKIPLPIAWILRGGHLIGKLFTHTKTGRKIIDGVSAQDVENYSKELAYVGLQFSDEIALPD